MKYPPIYHQAIAAQVAGKPKAETRQKIARALRWIKSNRGAAAARTEHRLFTHTAPEYFTR